METGRGITVAVLRMTTGASEDAEAEAMSLTAPAVVAAEPEANAVSV